MFRHRRQSGLGAGEMRQDLFNETLMHVIDGHGGKGPDAFAAAKGENQMVQPADAFEDRRHVCGVGGVHGKGGDFAGQRGLGGFQLLLVAAGDGHLEAAREQGPRRGEADTRRSADDDGVL